MIRTCKLRLGDRDSDSGQSGWLLRLGYQAGLPYRRPAGGPGSASTGPRQL